jgi:RND family efflux transporter MFP subunit
MNKKKTLLISLAILLAGGGLTALIFLTEPTAQRSGATKETAMLVEVTSAERGSYQPIIVATGTVQPSKSIILSSRVSGQIVRQYPDFAPGGFVQEGDMLVQIDPADYRNTLELRESDLQQAQAQLEIEQGRQDAARKGYELVDEDLEEMNTELVLRQPQLNSVKAQVEAAEAAVKQARVNLQRTRIRAPFDAHILSRNVNEGSQVNVGDNLGRIVGTDEYWVEVNVPLSNLRWLNFSDGAGASGSEVKIRDRKAWADDQYRLGKLYQLIGSLENQTRLARVLVSIPDPLAKENESLPTLIINAFVEAEIEAEELQDVIRLNRDYVREGETVWVMEDKELKIRKVDILFEDARYAYIRGGLEEGEQVVKTNLATVTEGAPLRLESDSASQQQARNMEGGRP